MESNVTIRKESYCCEMVPPGGYCPKPLEAASAFLSKKWTISIITTIGNFGKLRFSELEKRIRITPKTLSGRLKELESEGVVRREAKGGIPPRVEYSLTRRGMKLRNALVPLISWAESQQK